VLHEILSTALQVTDSGKLYNTMRHDTYNVYEDSGEEFPTARMIESKMVKCDGHTMKGEEKRGAIMSRTIVFCK